MTLGLPTLLVALSQELMGFTSFWGDSLWVRWACWVYWSSRDTSKPAIHGNCQGQTELSSPLLPMGVVSSRFLTGRALYASYRERVCICNSSFFGPEFLRLTQINGQA